MTKNSSRRARVYGSVAALIAVIVCVCCVSAWMHVHGREKNPSARLLAELKDVPASVEQASISVKDLGTAGRPLDGAAITMGYSSGDVVAMDGNLVLAPGMITDAEEGSALIAIYARDTEYGRTLLQDMQAGEGTTRPAQAFDMTGSGVSLLTDPMENLIMLEPESVMTFERTGESSWHLASVPTNSQIIPWVKRA